MPRDGRVGQETYEAVNKLVDGGMGRTEAFAQVAKERGARPGTVAASFYRVARAQGQSKPRGRKPSAVTARKSNGVSPTSAPPKRASGDEAAQLVAIIQGTVDRAVE